MSDLSNYMRGELWRDRVLDTISTWEKVQGVEVPEDVKDTIYNFMGTRIDRGIKKGTLMRTFMQIAVTSLIYIKMKRLDKI